MTKKDVSAPFGSLRSLRTGKKSYPPEFQTVDGAFSKRSESEQVARTGIELIHKS
jgi:hypothetical protein